MEIGNQEYLLKPGDIFLLYTDGLVEATNPEGERYESERLARVIATSATDPAEEILKEISRDVKNFMKRDHFDDDISVLILKIK